MYILLEWTRQKATESEKSWEILSIKKINKTTQFKLKQPP